MHHTFAKVGNRNFLDCSIPSDEPTSCRLFRKCDLCSVIFDQSNWFDILSLSIPVFYLHEINFFYLKSFTVKTAIYYNDPLITCITSDQTSVEMISLVMQLSGLNHHPTNWVYFTKFMPYFNRVANELVNHLS
jgi:hypothetical protein